MWSSRGAGAGGGRVSSRRGTPMTLSGGDTDKLTQEVGPGPRARETVSAPTPLEVRRGRAAAPPRSSAHNAGLRGRVSRPRWGGGTGGLASDLAATPVCPQCGCCRGGNP